LAIAWATSAANAPRSARGNGGAARTGEAADPQHEREQAEPPHGAMLSGGAPAVNPRAAAAV
jgi:hypothetical protein